LAAVRRPPPGVPRNLEKFGEPLGRALAHGGDWGISVNRLRLESPSRFSETAIRKPSCRVQPISHPLIGVSHDLDKEIDDEGTVFADKRTYPPC
jgi:hypothetical protein